MRDDVLWCGLVSVGLCAGVCEMGLWVQVFVGIIMFVTFHNRTVHMPRLMVRTARIWVPTSLWFVSGTNVAEAMRNQ